MSANGLGERIRAARKAKGWSLEQAAVYANLSVKTVWAAEHGRASRKTLRLLSDALQDTFSEEAAS